jgi:hypothetical protein
MLKGKKPIDIEVLLQWAFGELSKGRPVAASAWDNIEHYCLLGTRIDRSYRGPGDPLGLTPGEEPHEDAMTVAAIVAGLSNDQSFADVEDVRALMRDYEVPIIDANGEATVTNRLLPPGGMIENAIFAKTYQAQMAVIAHAVQAARPIWDVGPLVPRPVIGERRGQPRVIGKSYAGGRYTYGSFIPLEFTRPTIEQFVFSRAYYRVWLNALQWLAQELFGKLQDYEPLPPSAPNEPWIAGGQPSARVIESLIPAARIVAMHRPRAARPVRYRLGQAVTAAA